jgi:hypothetical protein
MDCLCCCNSLVRLKAECNAHGLKVSGTKAVLIQRIYERELQKIEEYEARGQLHQHCTFCGCIRGPLSIRDNRCPRCPFKTGPGDDGVGYDREGNLREPSFGVDGRRLEAD